MKLTIVVNKTLESGQKANVTAIIMGQFGRDLPVLYTEPIADASGVKHAGIAVNVVILEGKSGQLLTLVENARERNLMCIVFSAIGQSLSNNYAEYEQKISSSNAESTQIVGVGICGDDETVKILTKKFSLAK